MHFFWTVGRLAVAPSRAPPGVVYYHLPFIVGLNTHTKCVDYSKRVRAVPRAKDVGAL